MQCVCVCSRVRACVCVCVCFAMPIAGVCVCGLTVRLTKMCFSNVRNVTVHTVVQCSAVVALQGLAGTRSCCASLKSPTSAVPPFPSGFMIHHSLGQRERERERGGRERERGGGGSHSVIAAKEHHY